MRANKNIKKLPIALILIGIGIVLSGINLFDGYCIVSGGTIIWIGVTLEHE